MWHQNAATRKRGGDRSEKLFARQVCCHCGGSFRFVGNVRHGFPDFTCENCDQLVDVKSSPQAERTGNLAVSAIPWSHYPDNMLLVTQVNGVWIGEYKKFISTENQTPYRPTHRARATEFYLISWRNFSRLSDLGYQVSDETAQHKHKQAN
jgi:hypothetical protein